MLVQCVFCNISLVCHHCKVWESISEEKGPQSGEQHTLSVRRDCQCQASLVPGSSIIKVEGMRTRKWFPCPTWLTALLIHTHTSINTHTGLQKQQMARGLFPLYPQPPPPCRRLLKLYSCPCHSSTVCRCVHWPALSLCPLPVASGGPTNRFQILPYMNPRQAFF